MQVNAVTCPGGIVDQPLSSIEEFRMDFFRTFPLATRPTTWLRAARSGTDQQPVPADEPDV
jgi:hypothetical protein